MFDPIPFCRSLAQSPRPEDLALWLRIATDVAADPTSAAEGRWDALGPEAEATFHRCLERVDESDRLAVAKKLALANSAPPALLTAIAEGADDASLWALEHAENLPVDTLQRAVQDRRKARSIARRASLPAGMIDALLESEDVLTVAGIAANSGARLTPRQFSTLIDRARSALDVQGDRRLVQALLARKPVSAECAAFFLEASSAQRAALLLAAQRAELGHWRALPVREDLEGLIDRLERHALEGHAALFEQDLSLALQCAPDLAARIARDSSGEPLAVALAALRAPNDVSVRILTSRDLAEGSDYRRVGALARLQGALSPSAARAVISAITGAPGASEPSARASDRRTGAAPSAAGREAFLPMGSRPLRRDPVKAGGARSA